MTLPASAVQLASATLRALAVDKMPPNNDPFNQHFSPPQADDNDDDHNTPDLTSNNPVPRHPTEQFHARTPSFEPDIRTPTHADVTDGPAKKRARTSDSSEVPILSTRKRAATACRLCRTRKTKCSNGRPKCKLCADTKAECVYEDASSTSLSALVPRHERGRRLAMGSANCTIALIQLLVARSSWSVWIVSWTASISQPDHKYLPSITWGLTDCRRCSCNQSPSSRLAIQRTLTTLDKSIPWTKSTCEYPLRRPPVMLSCNGRYSMVDTQRTFYSGHFSKPACNSIQMMTNQKWRAVCQLLHEIWVKENTLLLSPVKKTYFD